MAEAVLEEHFDQRSCLNHSAEHCLESKAVAVAEAAVVEEALEHFGQQGCLNYWAEHCLESKAVVEEALEHFGQQSCLNC